MDKLTPFFETKVLSTFDAITDKPAQLETYLLKRIPGLEVETTFRVFPPAALIPSDPDARTISRFIPFFRFLSVASEMLFLAEEWGWVNNPLRPRDYLLPGLNAILGFLLSFTLSLVLNWAFQANSISFAIGLASRAKICGYREIIIPGKKLAWELFKYLFLFVLDRSVVQAMGGYEDAGKSPY
ncbi:hypothetical protein PG991_000156 [Apiospora marii]|uniref:Uncharacterized protein n=1 Tax=Apiospora marii TaxID=335849 RepID=A0ABR1T3Q9_9PEZI